MDKHHKHQLNNLLCNLYLNVLFLYHFKSINFGILLKDRRIYLIINGSLFLKDDGDSLDCLLKHIT